MDHHILALTKSMRKIGNVSDLALDWNWSGGGQVRMINRFMRIYEGSLVDSTKVIICEGAPSDCVATDCLVIFHKNDLLVTGSEGETNGLSKLLIH